MPVSRRVVLGTALGTVALGGLAACDSVLAEFQLPANPVTDENKRQGSTGWEPIKEADGTIGDCLEINGYAGETSVNVGQAINFHVSVADSSDYTIAIYRRGHYGGMGARLVTTSPPLKGVKQRDPVTNAKTGLITCGWTPTWTLDVGKDWVSGVYFAVFTAASGCRSYAPFVVRDEYRKAALLVVLPFSTYQAYNMWPKDGLRGKSLYLGYAAPDQALYSARARKVSFDRPYSGTGLGPGFHLDSHFAEWAESCGYDMTYASTIDLHAGRIDLKKFAGIVFSGHDEYWSGPMRANAYSVLQEGKSLAFMSANNMYWHVRFENASDGRPNRVMVCYKDAHKDPKAGKSGGTGMWREANPAPDKPEQSVLGVMYNGIVKDLAPLVVKEPGHWFWAGTGVKDGDLIPDVVGSEADGVIADSPLPKEVRQTLLSASPFVAKGPEVIRTQNTSLYETKKGAIVFAAGSLTWPNNLARSGVVDPRIQRATANVLDRIVKPS